MDEASREMNERDRKMGAGLPSVILCMLSGCALLSRRHTHP